MVDDGCVAISLGMVMYAVQSLGSIQISWRVPGVSLAGQSAHGH